MDNLREKKGHNGLKMEKNILINKCMCTQMEMESKFSSYPTSEYAFPKQSHLDTYCV